MKPYYLLFLGCLAFCLTAQGLTKGMTEQEVKAELGKPASQMGIGERTIWIYADQRKLEFASGKLIRENGLELKNPDDTQSMLNDNTRGRTQIEIPSTRKDLTITESARSEVMTAKDIGQHYSLAALSDDLSEALEQYEEARNTPATNQARQHIRGVLIGFILELVITMIVLQIAFSLSGFPSLFRQIVLLSLAVALAGAMLEYFLLISLLNPIRIGLSFMILLVLIRQMTDVREWATAIRIALLARFISLGLLWLAFAGVMVLFGM
jgi:heme/copper-type cytochrome/quinol oxidase subunit 4